jgi:protein gp37
MKGSEAVAGGKTSNIEWTDKTWNPVVGCTPVSPGCLNCYAATMARRLEAMGQKEYQPRDADVRREECEECDGSGRDPDVGECPVCAGAHPMGKRIRIAEVKAGRAVFTGEVRCVEERLTAPLHWKTPRMVFVNSMSDLFHEAVPFEYIDKVFAVMALCHRHTFQVLTKRPERMAEYFATFSRDDDGCANDARHEQWAETALALSPTNDHWLSTVAECRWPLPNVWLGTSVEDQQRADERIPHLLKCPAAIRFLSCEPLLGDIDLDMHKPDGWQGSRRHFEIGWVIVGGESGSGKGIRMTSVEYMQRVVKQCKAAGVPVFVKQIGTFPAVDTDDGDTAVRCHKCGFADSRQVFDCLGADEGNVYCPKCQAEIPCEWNITNRKGGDPAEWPEDLRVREMPEAAEVRA